MYFYFTGSGLYKKLPPQLLQVTYKLLSFTLLISLAIGGLSPALGQQPVVAERFSGIILDQMTGAPVPGVTIRLQGSCCQHQCINCQCVSDGAGKFSLDYSAECCCQDSSLTTTGLMDTLIIQAASYQPKTLVRHRLQDDTPLTVYLTPVENNLQEVIVTAAGFGQAREVIPAAVSVVDSLQMAVTKATQIDQLVNQVPGIYMADLGNEQHEMSIRQPITTKSLFLYLEDGLPIRSSGLFNHNALIEMNLAAAGSIEILKGPASAKYGPEAVGGAINIISAEPTEQWSGKLTAQGDNNGFKKTSLRLSNTFGKFGAVLSGYYANRKDGPIDFSDFHKSALSLNTSYQITPSLRWQNKATFVDYYADMSGDLDSLAYSQKNFNSHYQFTYRKVRAFRGSSILSKSWNSRSESNLSLVYRNNQIGQNPHYRIQDIKGDPQHASGQINQNSFTSYVGVLQHRQGFQWKNASLIMGLSVDNSPSSYRANYIDIHKNQAGDYDRYTDPDSLLTNYDTHILNYAAFLQWQMDLSSRLRLTLAGRYDKFDYKFTNYLPVTANSGAPSTRLHFSHWTPKIGLNYRGVHWGLYTSFSEGYVPPQVTELFNNIKVPFLKPQVFYNYEVGGWWRLINHRLNIDWSLYQMDGKGEIISVRNPDGSSENKNAGKTRHRGVELGVNYQPAPQFQIRVGGTAALHQFKNETQNGLTLDGNRMQAAPSVVANGMFTYRPGYVPGLSVALEYQRVGSYYMDDANTAKYNGFTVLNLRTAYQWKQFEIWAQGLNLLDTYYATMATKSAYGYSYHVGNPFTLAVGLAYQF